MGGRRVGDGDGLVRSGNENPLIGKDIHVDTSSGRRYSIDEDTGQPTSCLYVRVVRLRLK